MAVLFDASGDFLTRTTNLPPIATFTHMAWVYLTADLNVTGYALSYGAGGSYSVGVDADGVTLVFYNSFTAVNGTAWTVGTWKHLALVVEGTGIGQAKVYVNGTLTLTLDGKSALTGTTLRLGTRAGGDSPWTGRVAASKVWDVALTAAQVAQEVWVYQPVRWASLNAWAPLLTHTNVQDYTVNARDWTTGGTLTTEDGPPIAWGRLHGPSLWTTAPTAPSVRYPQLERRLRGVSRGVVIGAA